MILLIVTQHTAYKIIIHDINVYFTFIIYLNVILVACYLSEIKSLKWNIFSDTISFNIHFDDDAVSSLMRLSIT